MKPTTVFFVRHGEVYNPKDIVYLRTPRFRLSERGRQEVETTALVLRPKYINELRSSFQGVPRAEMNALSWNFYDNRKHPDDESREDVLARVQQQIRLTLRRNAGEAVVWVAHGDIVIITTLWGRGQPLSALSNFKGANYIAHASVTKFVFEPGQALPLSVDYFDPNQVS